MNQNEFNDGLLKEDSFRRICRNKIVNSKDVTLKCHFLHQFDPYLKLGPFKLEELWIRPYRIKIHDFLSNEEIEYFINVSKPYLSDARIIEKPVKKAESNVKTVHNQNSCVGFFKADVRPPLLRPSVHCTVQCTVSVCGG